MDFDALTAIDVHVHVHRSVRGRTEASTDMDARLADMSNYFGSGGITGHTVPEIAAYYRERAMGCVVFGVDSATVTGEEMLPTNEEVAELAAEHSDVVIPFASIDPARGAAGARAARRLIEDHGVRGFKFHPNTQEFFPHDRSAYRLYEVIAEYGSIALFHTGQTGVGAGAPGGGGVRLKYSNPMYVDDVAADFPTMKIILAHPSFPWQDEALAVATHKPSVYIDLSGWSPKYFPPQLVRYANTLLRDRVLFGSDFPVITPDRWLRDFDKLDIKPEVRQLVLRENAARLFGRETSAHRPPEEDRR